LRALSWTGPRVLAAATPRTREEALQAIDLAIGGLDISNLPRTGARTNRSRRPPGIAAKPAPELERRYPAAHDALARAAASTKLPIAELRFLPLISRQGSGSVVLAPPDARVVDVLPFDGFF
jgi:hypothetical protein